MSWRIDPQGALKGEINVPGDKSITHRAYILGAMSEGPTEIIEPLRAEDTDNTLLAVRSLGIVVKDRGSQVTIYGKGSNSFLEPEDLLDFGNSGTGVRLMAGVMATRPFLSILTGDVSLRKRPMARIVQPLRAMGARVDGRADGTLLPLVIRGGGLEGIDYTSPVASAQVKSCVLLAAMGAEGMTRFREPSPSRDHTERILEAMGVSVSRVKDGMALKGGQVSHGIPIRVPGDISSAAFFLVAGAIIEGSDVTVRNVGTNPTRIGIVKLLDAMGADVETTPVEEDVEPRADIRVRGVARLKGIRVPEEWIPSIIDELPLAAVLAACAEGTTKITGAGELRVKESDRIATTVEMINKAGARIAEEKDGFTIEGGASLRAGKFASHGDHRIAMSSAILSLKADGVSQISTTDCVATSFPDFTELLEKLSKGSIIAAEDE